MVELAVQGDLRLNACPLEVDRGGRSYTVETLRTLRDRGPADERFLILGGDAAAQLPAWREPEEILRLATIAVAEREGWERERVLEGVSGVPGAAERIVFFEMPRLDV